MAAIPVCCYCAFPKSVFHVHVPMNLLIANEVASPIYGGKIQMILSTDARNTDQ